MATIEQRFENYIRKTMKLHQWEIILLYILSEFEDENLEAGGILVMKTLFNSSADKEEFIMKVKQYIPTKKYNLKWVEGVHEFGLVWTDDLPRYVITKDVLEYLENKWGEV